MKVCRWELHWYWTDWALPSRQRFAHNFRMYDWLLNLVPFLVARWAK